MKSISGISRSPSEKLAQECTEDLNHRWNNRQRVDRAVTGSITLAFYRGYHAGVEAAEAAEKRRKRREKARSKKIKVLLPRVRRKANPSARK